MWSKIRLFVVMGIILAILFGVWATTTYVNLGALTALGVANTPFDIKSTSSKVTPLGDEMSSYSGEMMSLTFNSLQDLEKFYSTNYFVYYHYKSPSNPWVGYSVSAQLKTSSLHYFFGGKEYFVILPMGVVNKNTNELRTITPKTQISISNLPKNVVVILTGFSSSQITLNNIQGTVLIGVLVQPEVEYHTTVLWFFHTTTISKAAGTSGIQNTAIISKNVNKLMITSYLSDSGTSNIITVQHSNEVILSGVSTFAWATKNKGWQTNVPVVIKHVHNFIIKDSIGVYFDENNRTTEGVFGYYSRGYGVGLYLQYIDNFYLNGTLYLSGFSPNNNTGLFADHVYHFGSNLKNNEIQFNGDEGDLYMYYNVTESYKVGTKRNGDTVVFDRKNTTRYYFFVLSSSRINKGNPFDYAVISKFYGNYGLNGSFFSYKRYGEIEGGVDLNEMKWNDSSQSGNSFVPSDKNYLLNNPKLVKDYLTFYIYYKAHHITHHFYYFEDVKVLLVGKTYTYSSAIFERTHNGITYYYTTEFSPTNVFIYKHLLSNTTLVLKNGGNGGNASINGTSGNIYPEYVRVIEHQYKWDGFVHFKVLVWANVTMNGFIKLDNLNYGISVPDNGGNESSLVAYVKQLNGTPAAQNVKQIVQYYAAYNSYYTPLNFLFPYLSLSTFMVFLVSFAFVRWAYLMILHNDTPEEVAKNKQLLKHIFIGAVIIFFVLYNYGVILNVFSFP